MKIAWLPMQIVLCMICAAAELKSQGPEFAETRDVADTSSFFAPKTRLEDLRFAYHWETGLFMELKNEQAALLDKFLEEFAEVGPDTHTPFLKDHSPLNRVHQQFLSGHIPESIGDRYCVYFPDQCETAVYRIKEFALKPTGDGGFSGFLAKLESAQDEDSPATELTKGDRRGPLLLAFRSDADPSKPARMSEAVTDPEVRRSVAAVLERIEPLRDQEMYACEQFYLEYPDTVGYLARVRGTYVRHYPDDGGTRTETYHPSFLFCLVPSELEPRVVPFPFDYVPRSDSVGGLMIEVEDYPANDLSPYETEIYVLPDLDGDGSCELLVDTTVMELFRFVRNENETGTSPGWTIERVTHMYFGP